jgi:hypothetical protein
MLSAARALSVLSLAILFATASLAQAPQHIAFRQA